MTSKSILPILLFLLTSIPAFAQGPLIPPAAPTPTMKTLDQIEPRTDIQRTANPLPTDANYHFIIDTPGSYYLSSNLFVTKPNGIHVTVAGVTIDLNGFQISRVFGATGDGITIDPSANRCSVRNGSLATFAYGIQCVSAGNVRAKGGTFAQIAVFNCAHHGLFAGEGWELAGCKAHDNGGDGIETGAGATLDKCAAYNNAGTGLVAGSGSTLLGCTASKNKGNAGILTGAGSTLTGCVAAENESAFGINAGSGSTLSRCAARGNIGAGNLSFGIYSESGATIVACTATGNTSTNATAFPSTGVGIRAGSESTIKECTVADNKGDGIWVTDTSTVMQNNCNGSGTTSLSDDGAGIHVTGTANRVEANNLTDNRRGIDIDGTGNLIVKNSARVNLQNYAIVADNRYGPIINLTAGGGAAATGNTAASTVSSSEPWANFAY